MQAVLTEVVKLAHERPYSLQSDFARQNAQAVALAASLGYISCLDTGGEVNNRWFVTSEGLTFLKEEQNGH